MSELSLIPFGLKLPAEQLVDVSEVDRGKECNCICPSCRTPLIARQGDIKEWHFAHASKGTFSATEKECEYSFWVSVTLMAKQVLETADHIKLPSLTMYTNDSSEIKVSEQTTVNLKDIKIDQKVNSISVDAILKLGGYIVAVLFTAPHRNLEDRIKDITRSDEVGILEISLNKAMQWLYENENKGKYTQALKTHVLDDNECKCWHYHPRQNFIEKKYNITLNKSFSATPEPPEKATPSIKHKHYKCNICDNRWYGTHVCNNCKTHLYSTETKDA